MHGVQSKDGFIDVREAGGLVYEAKVLKMRNYFKMEDQADEAKFLIMSKY